MQLERISPLKFYEHDAIRVFSVGRVKNDG